MTVAHSFFRQSRERLARIYPRQRGLTAIIMLAFIVAFSGLFILSIDGVRALQNKARFDEALDIATLAVSSNDLNDISTPQRKNIVKNYFNAYFNDITIADNDISITATEGTCTAGDVSCIEGAVYTQYDINVEGAFTKIMGEGNGGSFTNSDGTYDVAGGGAARRFDANALVEPKDIIFVTDFSGSMDWDWYGNKYPSNSSADRYRHSRYIEALDVIDQIAATLQTFNESVEEGDPKNTVGMVPFGKYTYDSLKRAEFFIKQDEEGSFRYTDRVWSWSHWSYIDILRYITLNMYTPETTFLRTGYSIDVNGASSSVDYKNVELTTEIDEFRATVKTFSPTGATASYKGLIRGAIMAAGANATNAKRVIIILSDGDDTAETGYYKYNEVPHLLRVNYAEEYYDEALKTWVNLTDETYIGDNATTSYGRPMGKYFVDPDNDVATADGFCTYIRNKIQGQVTADGEEVSLDMIFIRFGAASLATNHWVKSCISSGDIYAGDEVESWDDVVDIIESLVLDEGQYLYSP